MCKYAHTRIYIYIYISNLIKSTEKWTYTHAYRTHYIKSHHITIICSLSDLLRSSVLLGVNQWTIPSQGGRLVNDKSSVNIGDTGLVTVHRRNHEFISSTQAARRTCIASSMCPSLPLNGLMVKCPKQSHDTYYILLHFNLGKFRKDLSPSSFLSYLLWSFGVIGCHWAVLNLAVGPRFGSLHRQRPANVQHKPPGPASAKHPIGSLKTQTTVFKYLFMLTNVWPHNKRIFFLWSLDCLIKIGTL